MDPLALVLLAFIIVAIVFFGAKGTSSRSAAPTPEERIAQAKALRSQGLDAVIAAHAQGKIDTATRDAQLGHISRLPIDPTNEGKR
jgi:hypothetical protein